jgi:transposase
MSRVEPLVLQPGDEQVLRELTRASSISAGLAQRARILLLAAEGRSNVEIGRLVGVSLPTVRLWRRRYGAGGVEALGDLHRSGRPAVHDETSIIAATLVAPPATLGVTHWSARLLGDHLGISFATVARIWRRWGLAPWKAETFKFSTDPELEAKITGVVGLYLDPPEKAVVVCIDTESIIHKSPAESVEFEFCDDADDVR